MFVDQVKLSLSAGRGGDGIVAWRREKFISKGGPSGGDGGKGASITIQASKDVHSLQEHRNRRIIKAQNGMPGGSNQKTGKNGLDIVLKVPLGTLVKDIETGEILYDFIEDGQTFLICKGGKGGKGNIHFKSPTNQAPLEFTKGTEGEDKEIEFELKLIADVGLVGIPNAGKSSLMSQITPLEVKVGAYPFTTLFPALSYLIHEQNKLLIADIPGIIEGAHADKGLGLEFLKHIERTSILVYVIDISGFEGRDPLGDFEILRSELKSYDPELLKKPFFVVLNKIDVDGALENVTRFQENYPEIKSFPICTITREGLKEFIQELASS
jgi:GTP-binding protein